jgi:hypothetical protein
MAMPEHRHLDPEERQTLASVWEAMLCGHCGYAHPGVCPRVRRTERVIGPGSQVTERVWYWEKWKPHPASVRHDDVFIEPPALIPARASGKQGKRAKG